MLWDQRQDLFAYAISFAVIGRFWWRQGAVILYAVNLVGVVLSGVLMFADARG